GIRLLGEPGGATTGANLPPTPLPGAGQPTPPAQGGEGIAAQVGQKITEGRTLLGQLQGGSLGGQGTAGKPPVGTPSPGPGSGGAGRHLRGGPDAGGDDGELSGTGYVVVAREDDSEWYKPIAEFTSDADLDAEDMVATIQWGDKHVSTGDIDEDP